MEKRKRQRTKSRIPAAIRRRDWSAETLERYIATVCRGDPDLIAAAPPDVERLVRFKYFKPGKVPRLVSVDVCFDPWLGVGIDATDSGIDHELEAKLGIQYEIPSRHRRGTYPIRALVAQHLRNLLGHRYRPETLPDLATSITYIDDEDVVVTTPPFPRETRGMKSPVHVAAPGTGAASYATTAPSRRPS